MEQDAEGLLWSSYRTIGAGWPDFYALLREPAQADAEALRLSINALYAHAGANRDHRDLRRRFYFQMLQEKVLPEARRILLDESARQAYNEQWSLHQQNAPQAISYENFLAALPGARQASGQLDAQIAQELTARLEAQLAAQRAPQKPGSNDDEMTPDEMGALPVSSPPESQRAPAAPAIAIAATTASSAASSAASDMSDLSEASPGQVLQVLAAEEAAQDQAAQPMRVRGGGRLLAGAASPLVPAVPASGASVGAAAPRITVGLSNEEMRAIGRRSQRRWARRSAIRLGLGALAVAMLGAGTTWALLRGVPRASGGEAENRLAASVENAITRAIERAEQPATPASNATAPNAIANSVGANSTRASSAAPAGAQASVAGVSRVAANVPRLRLDTLLQNADFEGLPNCNDGDLKPWGVWSGGRNSGLGSAFAVGTGKEQDARSGRWRLVFWKDKPYEASVSQIVRNLRPGLYQLNAWTKRSGGQEWAGIVIANYGGPRIHTLVPASRLWTPISIRNIRVTNGQIKIGFYTRSLQGKKWLAVDAVEFQRQS